MTEAPSATFWQLNVGFAFNWIDGRYVAAASKKTFDAINPATGERITRLADSGGEDVDAAVAAAERGFAEWSAMSGAERGRWGNCRRTAAKVRTDLRPVPGLPWHGRRWPPAAARWHSRRSVPLAGCAAARCQQSA